MGTKKATHKLYKSAVESNDEISENVYLLSFQRTFDFIPGQVIGISLSPDIQVRLYSIASGSAENLVKILYDVKMNGQLTPSLSKLKKGDVILRTNPFGTFTDDEKPAYWIATGTGIAPFASMIYSGIKKNRILIHGSRSLKSFHFSNDFLSALGSNYIRCCSGEQQEDVVHGRVTQFLEESDDLPPGYMYYLCGRAEMVVDTREVLLKKNIPFDNIMAEIYF